MLAVASGQAALCYAFLTIADRGGNIEYLRLNSMAPRTRCWPTH